MHAYVAAASTDAHHCGRAHALTCTIDMPFLAPQVREFAECIVFYGGQQKEHEASEANFGQVYSNNSALLRKTFNLEWFTSTFMALVQLFVGGILYIVVRCAHHARGGAAIEWMGSEKWLANLDVPRGAT